MFSRTLKWVSEFKKIDESLLSEPLDLASFLIISKLNPSYRILPKGYSKQKQMTVAIQGLSDAKNQEKYHLIAGTCLEMEYYQLS
jgi:hypothetical protein